jgi:hypothetical protein
METFKGCGLCYVMAVQFDALEPQNTENTK